MRGIEEIEKDNDINEDSNKKGKIELEYYISGLEYRILGRFLGFITKEQFRDLVRSKEIQNNLITTETMPFSVLKKTESVENKRLVVSVNKINDKYDAHTLYVSQPLDYINFTEQEGSTVGIQTKEKGYINIEEV